MSDSTESHDVEIPSGDNGCWAFCQTCCWAGPRRVGVAAHAHDAALADRQQHLETTQETAAA